MSAARIVPVSTHVEQRLSQFVPEAARISALASATSIFPSLDASLKHVIPINRDPSRSRRVSRESESRPTTHGIKQRSENSSAVVSTDEKFASLATLVSAMNPLGMETRAKTANHDAIVKHFQLRRTSGEASRASYAKDMDPDEVDRSEDRLLGLDSSLLKLFADRRLKQTPSLSRQHHDSLRDVNQHDRFASEVAVSSGSVYTRLGYWCRWLWRYCHALGRAALVPIAPTGTIACCRDVVLMAAVIAQLLVAPFLPVYFLQSSTMIVLVIAFDTLFLLDSLLCFNTAHFDEKIDRLELSRRKIVKRFLHMRRKRWLIVDILSALPITTALVIGLQESHRRSSTVVLLSVEIAWALLRFLRRLSVLPHTIFGVRLLRVTVHLPFRLNLQRFSHLTTAIRIVVLFFCAVHYVACLWRATIADDTVVSSDAWSLYVADLSTSLEILVGHVPPPSPSASPLQTSVFNLLSLMIGAVAMALLTSSFALLLLRVNSNASRYQTKLASVLATMDKMQLPPKLQRRIHQYYDHLWVAHDATETNEIAAFTKELSLSLCLEVSLFKYMDLVLSVPFWRNCTADFVTQIMLHLQVQTFLPDDYVMRQGEIGSTLFLVNRGVCELRVSVDQDGKTKLIMPPTRRMHAGTAFGELALLMNYRRTATVRALTFVEMCTLEREPFQAILTRYREDRREVLREMLLSCMEKKAQRFVPFPFEQLLEGMNFDNKTPSPWEAAEALVDLILAPECVDKSIKFGFKDLDSVSHHRLMPVSSPSAPSAVPRPPEDLLKRLDIVEQRQEETLQRLAGLELGMQSIARELANLSAALGVPTQMPQP